MTLDLLDLFLISISTVSKVTNDLYLIIKVCRYFKLTVHLNIIEFALLISQSDCILYRSFSLNYTFLI